MSFVAAVARKRL